jgi:hypothetical protein
MMNEPQTSTISSATESPADAMSIAVSGDGRTVAWVTDDHAIHFATETMGVFASHPTGPSLPDDALHVLEGAPTVAMSVSYDGRRVVTVDNGALGYVSVRAWVLATGQCLSELQGGPPGRVVATSRRGDLAALSTWDREVRLLSLDGPHLVSRVLCDRPIVDLVFVTGGARYAVGRDSRGCAVLIDFFTQIATCVAERVRRVFAVGGREVALLLDGGTVAVLTANTGELAFRAELGRSCGAVETGADGRALVSVNAEGSLVRLSLDDGGVNETKLWSKGRHRVCAVHVTAGAVVTSSHGGTHVRSIVDGRVIATLAAGLTCSASAGGTLAVGVHGHGPRAIRVLSAGVDQ